MAGKREGRAYRKGKGARGPSLRSAWGVQSDEKYCN